MLGSPANATEASAIVSRTSACHSAASSGRWSPAVSSVSTAAPSIARAANGPLSSAVRVPAPKAQPIANPSSVVIESPLNSARLKPAKGAMMRCTANAVPNTHTPRTSAESARDMVADPASGFAGVSTVERAHRRGPGPVPRRGVDDHRPVRA